VGIISFPTLLVKCGNILKPLFSYLPPSRVEPGRIESIPDGKERRALRPARRSRPKECVSAFLLYFIPGIKYTVFRADRVKTMNTDDQEASLWKRKK
jgi:hypothetical protein